MSRPAAGARRPVLLAAPAVGAVAAPASASEAAVSNRRPSAAWTLIFGAAGVHVGNSVFLAVCMALGSFTPAAMARYCAAWMLMTVLCSWVTLRAPREWMDWSQRALLHIAVVTAPGYLACYELQDASARHAYVIFGLLGMFGGLMWLRTRQILALALIISGYQFLVWLALRAWQPQRVEGLSDLISIIAYLAAGVQIAFLGGRVFDMDHRLRQRKIELNAAVGEIDRLVRTDELTGCFSRRHLLEHLEQQIRSPETEGPRRLAVMLLDLDHFKRVNDTLGHPAGDEVLRRFARCVWLRTPDEAVFGRQGGEEFLMIVSGRTPLQVQQLAEHLCASVASIDLTDIAPDLRLTCSIGVALAQGIEGADDLLGAADRALYRAKTTGRNRVVLRDAAVRWSRATGKGCEREDDQPAGSANAAPAARPSVRVFEGAMGELTQPMLDWVDEQGRPEPLQA